jgi:hypothetical protein
MWDILNFLVIFIVCSAVQSADVETAENSFNCYADYLKHHGLLEKSFESEPFNGESYLCEVVLSTTVETVYTDLLKEFSKNEELKDAAGCIVDNMRKAKWSDLDIKERVIDISELDDDVKLKMIFEIKRLQEKISSESIVSCLAEKEFGGLFEEIFRKDDQEDFVGDYCARVYAVDNKLIDTNVNSIVLNPHNIKTDEVNCDVINKQHFDHAEKELKEHLLKDIGENAGKAECLIKKYHDNHYFNRTLAIEFLGELNISEEQKKEEKSKFIEIMIKITKELSDC